VQVPARVIGWRADLVHVRYDTPRGTHWVWLAAEDVERVDELPAA
jgi:hypothetical protein